MSVLRRLTAGWFVCAATVAAAAAPASAHALLLRTVPSPQSTVRTAPTTVRLGFSEPVEVAFGAVRVFDVDGHRVDSGSISRSDSDREVDVATPRLKSGTFTVTWRVVSADGHSVHGGFSFYVGAPSTISPVAIAMDRGAGRVIGWGFGVVRFAWFGALCLAVGLVVVRRWVWTPTFRSLGLEPPAGQSRFRRAWPRWLPSAWAALGVATVLSLIFEAASVSGLGLWSSVRPSVLREVLPTSFGRAWEIQTALVVIGVLPVFALVRRRRTFGWPPTVWIGSFGVVVVALCGTAAANGHARTTAHPSLAIPTLGIHLAAVTVWLGGLAVLMVLGVRSWRQVDPEQRPTVVRTLAARFGRVAAVAAGALLVSGVVEALGDLASTSDLWRTDWGRVLSAKVILFALAIALAARHRLVSPLRFARPDTAGREVARFRRTARIELGILTAALVCASALVVLAPGRSLALAANGPINRNARIASYTVQLLLDPSAVGPNQVHLTYSEPTGLAAGEVSETTLTLGPAGSPGTAIPMRLISPGHFVGDATLPAAGRYWAAVSTPAGGTPAHATFAFSLHGTPTR